MQGKLYYLDISRNVSNNFLFQLRMYFWIEIETRRKGLYMGTYRNVLATLTLHKL